MTIMPTNTRELSINRLLALAAKTAGIMAMEQLAEGSQWNARASYGRDQLELVIKALQIDGVMMRDVEITQVAIVAGTSDYVLDSDTLDVQSNGMFRVDGETAGTFVRMVDREEYIATPDRSTAGTPTRFWVERGASVTLRLPDTPDQAGTLEIARQRLLADSSDGNATPDLERHWHDYLHYELAARYAQAATKPVSEVESLRTQAKDLKDIAKAKAKQNVMNQMELDHPTAWS